MFITDRSKNNIFMALWKVSMLNYKFYLQIFILYGFVKIIIPCKKYPLYILNKRYYSKDCSTFLRDFPNFIGNQLLSMSILKVKNIGFKGLNLQVFMGERTVTTIYWIGVFVFLSFIKIIGTIFYLWHSVKIFVAITIIHFIDLFFLTRKIFDR